ncbi:MAG: cellulase family glycosylhydrolase, partial [Paludibacter sp.]
MKKALFIVFVFISFCTFGREQQLSNDLSFVRVSKTDPRYFELSNGNAYIPVGPNICFPRLILDEKLGLENIEMMYKNLAKYGANYTRVMLGAEFFEIENKKQGVFEESQIERLDKVLALAKKYHLRVKFCFEQFRFLKDNTKRFPGSLTFHKPVYNIENGGSFSTVDEFFSTEKGKEVYMNRVSFIVNRYKNNPNVFGWELWNEINSVTLLGGEQSTVDWTKDILARVHKLDSNHLVMQNLGSFGFNLDRSIYKSITSIPNNDVAIVHRYIVTDRKPLIFEFPTKL